MSLKTWLLISLFFLCVGCNHKNTYVEQKTNIKTSDFKIDTSTLQIEITNKQESFYKLASIGKNGIYCGYNTRTKSLDLFSIPKRKLLGVIDIKNINGKELSDVKSILYVEPNSIFIMTRRNILKIDSIGKIKSVISINDFTPFFKDNHFREIDGGKNFFFNSKTKNLYVSNYAYHLGFRSKEFYEFPIISEVDTTYPYKMKTLPISYSKLYLTNYYGFMSFSQHRLSSDSRFIYYNFPIDPNIYSYNIQTKQTEIFGGSPNSNGILGRTIGASIDKSDLKNDDKKMLHFMESVFYYPVIDSENSKYKYRLYSEPKKYKENNTFNNLQKKNKYLSIFDSNFNLAANIALDNKSYYLNGAFSTKEGLCLPYPMMKGYLRFKLFTLQN